MVNSTVLGVWNFSQIFLCTNFLDSWAQKLTGNDQLPQFLLAQHPQSHFHRSRRVDNEYNSLHSPEKYIESSHDDGYHFLPFSWDACLEYDF